MQNSIEISATTTTNLQDNNSGRRIKMSTNNTDVEFEANDVKKPNSDDECDAIGDLIGHYGKWQFVMTILLSLFQVPNTFHIFSPTFQVS